MRLPKFLSEVLEAISYLNERKGSNPSSIISHVESTIKPGKNEKRPRRASMQVIRALQHAVNNGVVCEEGGRFRLVKCRGRPPKNRNLQEEANRNVSRRSKLKNRKVTDLKTSKNGNKRKQEDKQEKRLCKQASEKQKKTTCRKQSADKKSKYDDNGNRNKKKDTGGNKKARNYDPLSDLKKLIGNSSDEHMVDQNEKSD